MRESEHRAREWGDRLQEGAGRLVETRENAHSQPRRYWTVGRMLSQLFIGHLPLRLTLLSTGGLPNIPFITSYGAADVTQSLATNPLLKHMRCVCSLDKGGVAWALSS